MGLRVVGLHVVGFNVVDFVVRESVVGDFVGVFFPPPQMQQAMFAISPA